MTGTNPTSLEVRCSACGEPAARFAALDAGEGSSLVRGARLARFEWFGTCELPMPIERAEQWLHRIRSEPLVDLAREELDLFGFVCVDCGAAYCQKCWRVGPPVMDHGFYEETRGTCPHGHEQRLDD